MMTCIEFITYNINSILRQKTFMGKWHNFIAKCLQFLSAYISNLAQKETNITQSNQQKSQMIKEKKRPQNVMLNIYP